MSIELWLAFVAASTLMLLLPGPTILTVISYSVAHGRRAKLPLIAAVALGDSTALLLSLLGLGALLATSATWFTVIKFAGGLYLIILGIKLLTAKVEAASIEAPTALGPRWTLFANTWLVTALNPKGIVFFVAFVPQFIDAGNDYAPQATFFVATFAALGAINCTVYALAADALRRVIGSPRALRAMNRAGGAVIAASGVAALFARRPVAAAPQLSGSAQPDVPSSGIVPLGLATGSVPST